LTIKVFAGVACAVTMKAEPSESLSSILGVSKAFAILPEIVKLFAAAVLTELGVNLRTPLQFEL
jgi:hypothetical protein